MKNVVQYRETVKVSKYLFSDIEHDIIEKFLMEENLKSSLQQGVNKYSWNWQEESADDVGEYSVLVINEFILNETTRQAIEVPRMKIIPVDKFDRIVQTSDQRKKYSSRAAQAQELEQKMIKKGMKLKVEHAQNAKTPSFAPISDPEFINGE